MALSRPRVGPRLTDLSPVLRYWVPTECVSSVKHLILQHLPVFRMWQVPNSEFVS